MIHIRLDRIGIDDALRQVSPGLRKYVWLQAELNRRDVSRDREYQTRFNRFYRVRRNAEWRRAFYDILQQGKSRRPSLSDVLDALHKATGRVEASFASKLVATIDPSQPVIDSIVLRNLGLRLPSRRQVSLRIDGIVALRDQMVRSYSEYIHTRMGRYLVKRFMESYPETQLTEVKMLDLVLWQTRKAG